MHDPSNIAPSDSSFRTRSPEQAIDFCAEAYHPHRLTLLGPPKSFGLRTRVTQLGPITTADATYETDVAIRFDDTCGSYQVVVPLQGWLESRHRGQQLTSTPAVGSIYRPDASITATRWPAGSRHLAVKIDQLAVDKALESLIDEPVGPPIAFDAPLPIEAGAAREWVRLLLTVSRQLECGDSIIRNPVVSIPLVESLIHGFLLVADHPYREVLAAPTDPARPTAVRDAMDIIESGPHLLLTTSTLAAQCHVSVRTLQKGFGRHLGMSPMAYARVVRLRCAHRDLLCAHPSDDSVASIAQRWGFTHLGRFAAAHKAMYGETPLQTLRSAR
jgi:AraC-like DNA-binding protein